MTLSRASSARTLTGQLATFFTAISVVIGFMVFVIIVAALRWSEDRINERRILVDKQSAVEQFLAGEDGHIKLDPLTDAYNDIALVPEVYRELIKDKQEYIGEVGEDLDPLSHFVYKSHYLDKGEKKDLVLLSLVDQIELSSEEIFYAGVVVVTIAITLMTIFNLLLSRLSKQLIEPLNGIVNQLRQNKGDAESPFEIEQEAVNEFQILTSNLNGYRDDLRKALKREQAFARYASHELRTPLTVVKGANKLLSVAKPDAFQTKQIDRINDASEQMQQMVDTLLSLVRYEKSPQQTEQRTLQQAELEHIAEASKAQADEKAIAITIEMSNPPQVKATQAVMAMIIGNLLRNAIAASDHGEVSIVVDQHSLQVIDDGPGLGASHNEQGHGLGLLIVDELCIRYDWTFSLDNHPQRGCIAKIEFGEV